MSGLALLLSVELAIPIVWRPRWLYCWFLPLVWTTVAWNNFYYPGDEYSGFFVGSIAGLWLFAFLTITTGTPAQAAVVLVTTGAATVAIAGCLLDKLRAPLILWAVLFAATAMGLLIRSLSLFPTMERALAKNGSYEAYILPSINIGITFATLAMLIGVAVYRLLRHFLARRAA